MAGAEVLRAVTLDRLLECELNAQEAILVLQALEETLRGAPDTVQAPAVSGVGAWKGNQQCMLRLPHSRCALCSLCTLARHCRCGAA